MSLETEAAESPRRPDLPTLERGESIEAFAAKVAVVVFDEAFLSSGALSLDEFGRKICERCGLDYAIERVYHDTFGQALGGAVLRNLFERYKSLRSNRLKSRLLINIPPVIIATLLVVAAAVKWCTGGQENDNRPTEGADAQGPSSLP